MTMNPPARKPQTAAATITKEISRRADVIFTLAIFVAGLLLGHAL